MGLESATYISDLNVANPDGADGKSQGDDHLRLIKAVLKATFPNITGVVNATHGSLVKHNIAGGAAPTVNEDSGDGYSEGSIWINLASDQAYICVDDTVAAAVWKALTGVASGMRLMFFQSTITMMTGWTFVTVDQDYIVGFGNSSADGGTNNGVTASNAGWEITGGTHAHTHTFSDTATTGAPSGTVVRDFSTDPYDSASSSHTHSVTVSGTTSGVSVSALSFTGAWRPPITYGTVWSKN